MTSAASQLEAALVEKLRGLKYDCRTGSRDREALGTNFRQNFEALNSVRLNTFEAVR